MSPLTVTFTLLTLTLSYLTLTSAQCPAQSSIFNDTSLITPSTSYKSIFLNQSIVERPQSGKVKDGLIAAIGGGITCDQITIMNMRPEFGDGWTWGSVVDFVIPASAATAYESSVATPLPNPASNSLRTPLGVPTLIAIPTSTLSNYLINGQAVRNRNQGIVVIGNTGSQSQIAAQPCEVSEWDQCDGCKSDKVQIVSRRVIKPAVGGGSCPALQMRMYCDRKCLTDWQIGLIALACFLFVVACCICCYCIYRRRHPDTGRERAAAKQRELETPAVVDEKIDVDVVDPVRPSTADEGSTMFHRESQDTVTTGPRPTATFHDDEPDETDTKPVPEEKEETVTPAPVPAAVAGAPRANVVRVHL